MLDFQSLASGAPILPVSPNDVKRVWRLIRETAGERPVTKGGAAAPVVSFDARLIAQQCGSGADVLAVFFRTVLLQELLEQGMLNDWREGNELRDTVFDAAATFPLQNGLKSFDPDAFMERLRCSPA